MERFPRTYTSTAEHNTPSANNSAAADRSKRRQRSRVTNGSALLTGVDGRSAWVRRCKDIIEAHLSDLGGEDNTSAAERSLIRRAAVLTTELERLEARFASAGEASERDLDLYIRAAGNLRRLLEALGLQRRPRDVAPTLGELLREDAMRQRNG
jgi:phytoene dehydrogenase-like protein